MLQLLLARVYKLLIVISYIDIYDIDIRVVYASRTIQLNHESILQLVKLIVYNYTSTIVVGCIVSSNILYA